MILSFHLHPEPYLYASSKQLSVPSYKLRPLYHSSASGLHSCANLRSYCLSYLRYTAASLVYPLTKSAYFRIWKGSYTRRQALSAAGPLSCIYFDDVSVVSVQLGPICFTCLYACAFSPACLSRYLGTWLGVFRWARLRTAKYHAYTSQSTRIPGCDHASFEIFLVVIGVSPAGTRKHTLCGANKVSATGADQRPTAEQKP